MKRTLCLALLLIFGVVLLSQAQSSTLKQANRQYEMLAYANAIELFEEALKGGKLADAEKLRSQIRLAHSYKQVRDGANAERVYRELVGKLGTPTGEDIKVLLHYAQVLASNGKTKEAQPIFEKYSELQQEDDQRGKAFSNLYKGDMSHLTKNAGSYKVDYLNINSSRADFSPMYYKNGLVFCSGRGENESIIKRVFSWDKSAFLDLYYINDISSISGSRASGLGTGADNGRGSKGRRVIGSDEYTSPTANDTKTIGTYGGVGVNAGMGYEEVPESESERFSKTINSKYHEGPACFTSDGSKIIFTRNNFNNGSYKQSSDGVNKLKIYTATERGGAWGEVQEVPFNSDEYSTGHPTITKDNKIVYFASDMPGGFGGTDIYMVEYNNGSWGIPKNLGKGINTKGNEMFPYVDENGNMYFSSDGHPGLGDMDIFFVLMEGGYPKGKVINLGEPLNSNRDDFGIITDGNRKTGYFSSNRKRGGIDDDIYRFVREGSLYACRELTVVVFDSETKMPLDSVEVEVTLKGGQAERKKTDKNGSFSVCVDDTQDYTFRAIRNGYGVNTVGFASKGEGDDQPSRLEIALNKIKVVVVEQPPVQPKIIEKVVVGPKVTVFEGKALGPDGKPLAGVTVRFRNDCDQTIQEVITGIDGVYKFDMVGGCDYTMETSKDEYETITEKITKVTTNAKRAPKVVKKDIMMIGKLSEGMQITIDNIYYDLGKWNIRSDAARELDKLVGTLSRFPNMTVEIGSHTDSRGEFGDNKSLSQKRANSVVDYLVKKGISRGRLVANGYGESMLVNQCADGVTCTEAEHQKNRRTTLKILKLN